ncbi:ATP-dependent helicase [Firmicutes bacterium AM29-6AC]|uniref:DNA 3'-5' helicase n=1 Tax=Anaerotignum faecicola TaxID=2358141 RepID=A0A401LAK4_9FIRM|nr:ATP-dependent helicase [Anaerotignum faecicola]RHR12290.1 ATP-dependent helicase [Firmicutes bacterium AF19-2LB]RHT37703.1 ATP-dependent helicase [Firmicutes bacterium AM29-6AC]GCB28617.1 DNA helicase [Anaerotignum faecicola]
MGKKLNTAQQKAVCHETGPMLVLAGPGSGKTTVLLCRISRLLERGLAKPQEILALTFSKVAAEEMKSRFENLNGASGVSFGTFHSIFFRILRSRYGWNVEQIFQEEERRSILRNSIEAEKWDIPDLEEYISQFFSQLSLMNSELEQPNRFTPTGMPVEEFRKLYRAYEGYKERHEKLDFDDMLTQCYQLLREDAAVREYWQRKYKFILVDEFQDVNQAQFACLQILAEKHQNLFVVGDDDQSIYAFRGARPDFLLHFPTLYPAAKKVTLNTNYRSTERIVNLAERVIGNNEVRFVKNMKGIGEAGDKVTFFLAEDAAKEAAHIAEKIGRLLDEGVPLTEIAVIYRTNLQGGAFARELYKRGIPYDLRDNSGNVYEHWVAKDLLAYLLLAENEESDSALRRILNKPKRYIGKDLLAEAETMPYTLLRSFFVCPSLKGWQEENLENLRIDLNQIRKRTPYDALKYIRKVIGYDEYLEEFAAYRRTSAQVLQEIADEIMETAKDCADVRSFREQLERLSLQMKEQSRKKGQKRNGVALMTMHGAKGLEFRAVFLPSLVEGIVPHEKGMDTVAEERRLFYVAMTRASEKLCLSAILQRYEKERKPSRFLAEMGLDAEMAFRKNKEKEGNKR